MSFHEVSLPSRLAFGSTGGVERRTEVVTLGSGFERRSTPWAQAHVRIRLRADGGRDLGWIARSRLDGDRWDGPGAAADPSRFRVRVLDGGIERRAFEVADVSAVYAAADLAADFPAGMDAGRVAVSQWGERFGWGLEAISPLN